MAIAGQLTNFFWISNCCKAFEPTQNAEVTVFPAFSLLLDALQWGAAHHSK
jgi:hypothetical protein